MATTRPSEIDAVSVGRPDDALFEDGVVLVNAAAGRRGRESLAPALRYEAELVVVPDATHMVSAEKTDEFNRLPLDYFELF